MAQTRLPDIIFIGDDLSFQVEIRDGDGVLFPVDSVTVSARGPTAQVIAGAATHSAGIAACVFNDVAWAAGYWDVRVRATSGATTQTVFHQRITVQA